MEEEEEVEAIEEARDCLVLEKVVVMKVAVPHLPPLIIRVKVLLAPVAEVPRARSCLLLVVVILSELLLLALVLV
jgi:hypothetical protein